MCEIETRDTQKDRVKLEKPECTEKKSCLHMAVCTLPWGPPVFPAAGITAMPDPARAPVHFHLIPTPCNAPQVSLF